MTVEIKGLEQLNKNFSVMSKQLPFALMNTLNDLGFDSRSSLNKEIKGGLKVRVNTSKAFVVKKAKKTNLEAIVRIKEDWHKLSLMHHYKGGRAAPITFEKAMYRRGYIGKGQSVIPIKKTGKAKYRTLLKETVKGEFSYYFVASSLSKDKRVKHLEPGIYRRKYSRKTGVAVKVQPVALFTREAEYKKRFDMMTTVKKVVSRRAETYFYKNLDKAMRTAR